MPRHSRLEIPGIPMHVTQRGVNRAAIFVCDADRRHFITLLESACEAHEVSVHAYVLMDNHIHLLVSAKSAGRIAPALSLCFQRYVWRFNRNYARTGTLFQGRFKSCLVDNNIYLLRVMRYIELNPVRAHLVAQPEDYPWSSARSHLGLRHDPLVRFDPVFEQLAACGSERAEFYRRWLMQPLGAEEMSQIRLHLSQERALGEGRFQSMVEKTLGVPATVMATGIKRSSKPRSA